MKGSIGRHLVETFLNVLKLFFHSFDSVTSVKIINPGKSLKKPVYANIVIDMFFTALEHWK